MQCCSQQIPRRLRSDGSETTNCLPMGFTLRRWQPCPDRLPSVPSVPPGVDSFFMTICRTYFSLDSFRCCRQGTLDMTNLDSAYSSSKKPSMCGAVDWRVSSRKSSWFRKSIHVSPSSIFPLVLGNAQGEHRLQLTADISLLSMDESPAATNCMSIISGQLVLGPLFSRVICAAIDNSGRGQTLLCAMTSAISHDAQGRSRPRAKSVLSLRFRRASNDVLNDGRVNDPRNEPFVSAASIIVNVHTPPAGGQSSATTHPAPP